jgi:hypothetical protein
MSQKLPWVKWVFEDWMRDTITLSLGAAGFWSRLLVLMNRSPRRGYLLTRNGKPYSLEQLARDTHCTTDETSRLLRELEDAGVYSTTSDGVAFNRRMVRDEHKRRLCSDAGKKGGGNPTFKGVDKGPSKVSANDASYSLSYMDEYSNEIQIPLPFQSERFLVAWKDWIAYRKEQQFRTWKPKTIRSQFKDFASWGEEAAIAAIEQSIKHGWQGVFEPKGHAGHSRLPLSAQKPASRVPTDEDLAVWTPN